MMKLLKSTLTSTLVVAGLSFPAVAQEMIMVEVDRAEVMRLDLEAATIVVGNPAIADAVVFDRNTLILTGKSFGSTNMLVLDDDNIVVGEFLMQVVGARDTRTVVYRGNQRTTLNCAPGCEQTPTVGDNAQQFEQLNTQIMQRIEMATSQAGDE